MPERDRSEVILTHLEYIRRKLDELNDQQRALNGRVGTAERSIAVLQDRAEDVKAEALQAKSEAKKAGSLFGMLGVFAGGLVIAVYEHLVTKP